MAKEEKPIIIDASLHESIKDTAKEKGERLYQIFT